MMFRNKRKWMPGHTPMNTIEITETEEYKRIRARMESEKKTKKFVTDEKPTIPTFVGTIKNYSHRPLG